MPAEAPAARAPFARGLSPGTGALSGPCMRFPWCSTGHERVRALRSRDAALVAWEVLVQRILLSLFVAVALIGASAATADAHSRGHAIYYRGFHPIYSKKTAGKYLRGTSAGFKTFAARTGHHIRVEEQSYGSGGCADNSGMFVSAYQTRGFAYGGLGSCSGAVALWARVHGHWKTIVETQDVVYCSTLRRYGVPATVLSKQPAQRMCYIRKTNREVRYRHG